MSIDDVKKWGYSALGILTMASSLVDWPALARTLVAHPRGARFIAGLVWLAAHLHTSPLDKGGPK